MKKLYFLLSLFIVAYFSSTAQRQVNLQMMGTTVGPSATIQQPMTPYQRIYHDNKTSYFFGFILKNLGPDPLKQYDTVKVSFVDGVIYTGNHFSANAGDTIMFVPNLSTSVFYMPFGASLPSSDTLNWCDTVWVSAGPANGSLVDPDPNNNSACHYVEAYYDWRLAVDDVSTEHSALQLFPNPASASLTIKQDYHGPARNARITLRNILGAEVYTQSMQNTLGNLTHTADISQLPPGLYTAELHYNHRTVIQKFSIQ